MVKYNYQMLHHKDKGKEWVRHCIHLPTGDFNGLGGTWQLLAETASAQLCRLGEPA